MLRLPMVIGVRIWVSAISASLGSGVFRAVPPRHSSAHGSLGQRKSGDKIPPELIVQLPPGQPINELRRECMNDIQANKSVCMQFFNLVCAREYDRAMQLLQEDVEWWVNGDLPTSGTYH